MNVKEAWIGNIVSLIYLIGIKHLLSLNGYSKSSIFINPLEEGDTAIVFHAIVCVGKEPKLIGGSRSFSIAALLKVESPELHITNEILGLRYQLEREILNYFKSL